MTNGDQPQDPWNFPCEMPIKVMGPKRETLKPLLIEIVSKHLTIFDETDIKQTESRTGKYLSLTIKVTFENKSQVDALFADLAHHQQNGNDISFVI